jgi:hypothetical protein
VKQDDRHRRMTIIIQEPISRRSFGEWTMGLAHLSVDELSTLEGANDFFQHGHILESIDAGRAKKLLQVFKKGRWRARLTLSQPVAETNPRSFRSTHLAPDSDNGARVHLDTRPAFTFFVPAHHRYCRALCLWLRGAGLRHGHGAGRGRTATCSTGGHHRLR